MNFINNINIDIESSPIGGGPVVITDIHFLSRNPQEFRGTARTVGSLTMVLTILSIPTYLVLRNLSDVETIIVDSIGTMDHFPQRLGPADEIFLLPSATDIWAKTISGNPARLWIMVCGSFD